MKHLALCMIATVFIVEGQTQTSGNGIDRLSLGPAWTRNREELKSYTHKRRTEITVKGKTPGPRIDLVRYVDGKMETVPLETPARTQPPRGRGLRGKIIENKIEKKKEEMKEEVERMTALLQRFTPGSESMKAALQKASITRSGAGPDAAVTIAVKGVAKPSDSFTLVWSIANRRPVQTEIHADHEGNPVTITINYASLPEGLFYAAQTVISAPKKDLRITIDTFDYMKSLAK